MTNYKIGEPVEDKKLKKHKSGVSEWMVFWLVVSVVLIAGCAVIAHKHTLIGWQARIFYDINNPNPGSIFVSGAKIISNALGAAYPIAACILIPLVFKKYRVAWRFLVTVGGAGLLAEIIKRLVKEPRPAAMLHGHLHQRVMETGYGFPSAHTTVAAAMAITLWFYLPAKWRFVSIIWIVLVAWSRLFLGAHSPVDVVGGFACGLLAVCIVRLLPKFIAKPLRLDD